MFGPDATTRRMNNPKIIGLAMVKNEQDIVEAFVRHNIRFLERLVVLENGSVDETRQILGKLTQEFGNLTVIEDQRFSYTQSERMTGLLQRFQAIFHADYVIPLDADEFLDATDRSSLCAELRDIPAGGCGLVPWCTFVLTPDSVSAASDDPPRSMVWRRRVELPAYSKAILGLMGSLPTGIVIEQGNHSARFLSGGVLPSVTLNRLRLLHYPVRSRDQLIAKSVVGWMAYLAKDVNAAKRGQGVQWQTNFERIASGQSIDPESLCEMSVLYAQVPRIVNWRSDVIRETPWLEYQRRYSTGRCLGAMGLIVRCWEQSVMDAQGQLSAESRLVAKDETTNYDIASRNLPPGPAGEAGKQRNATIGNSAAQLVQEGKLDDAEKLFESALAQRETAELWNNWATVQYRHGRNERAEQGFRRALSLDGSERQPAINLAALLLTQGRFEESIPVLQPIVGKLTLEEKEALRQLTTRWRPTAPAEITRYPMPDS